MRRRELLSSLGAIAILWPFAARGEHAKTPVVGFLCGVSPANYAARLAAFREGLETAGYDVGRNVTVDYRWADGHSDRLPSLAADLVRRRVDVILSTGGNGAALAAKAATRDIPIVFTMGGDPVKLGVVASLNRPGGNATGITFFTLSLGPKRLQLLHELVPGATAIALLVNPDMQEAAVYARDVERSAQALGLRVMRFSGGTGDQIDQAFAAMARQHATALMVGADPTFVRHGARLVALAARYRIPTVYPNRGYIDKGGLLSYGPSVVGVYRQAGVYVGRVLAGANPAELPVTRPTDFELVINRKTAGALGIAIPPTLLDRADEVLE